MTMTTWQKEEIEVKSGTNGKTRIGGRFAGPAPEISAAEPTRVLRHKGK